MTQQKTNQFHGEIKPMVVMACNAAAEGGYLRHRNETTETDKSCQKKKKKKTEEL